MVMYKIDRRGGGWWVSKNRILRQTHYQKIENDNYPVEFIKNEF